MNRPTGITVTAVILFVFAVLELLAIAFWSIGIYAVRHGKTNTDVAIANSTTPLSPEAMHLWMQAAMGVIAIGGALLLLWTVVSAIGLLRLRDWARISTLIFSGCLAVYSLFTLFTTAISLVTAAHIPNQTPHVIAAVRIIMALTGLAHLALLALAAWWLFYFNQTKTRTVFIPQKQQALTN